MAKKKPVTKVERPVCGLVMPISAIDGLSSLHWLDVREIITTSVMSVGFQSHLVSDADESGVIQARIVKNLYSLPIVVIDVSCKNPNVMFELGMRLAFDKPTVVIKDDKTDFSFDTSPVEHLGYPRDLRYNQINDFKTRLAEKVKATYDKSQADSSYSTFLGHFGSMVPSHLHSTTVSNDEYIMEELATIQKQLTRLVKGTSPRATTRPDDGYSFEILVRTKHTPVFAGPFKCDTPTLELGGTIGFIAPVDRIATKKGDVIELFINNDNIIRTAVVEEFKLVNYDVHVQCAVR